MCSFFCASRQGMTAGDNRTLSAAHLVGMLQLKHVDELRRKISVDEFELSEGTAWRAAYAHAIPATARLRRSRMFCPLETPNFETSGQDGTVN